MPAQLHFVPRKEDLENILVRMQTKGIGSFTFRNRRWEGIRIFTKPNGSRQYLPFEGTAAEVLTGLLASRIIDSDLNAAINDMVREVVIQQKEGMPDAIKTQGLSS